MTRYTTALILMALSLETLAGPGKIAQSPVIDSSGIKPNVLLVLDDSYSMRYHDILNEGVEVIDEKLPELYHHYPSRIEKLVPTQTAIRNLNIFPVSGSKVHQYAREYDIDNSDPINPSYLPAVINYCLGINRLAYNPANTYFPWQGKNLDGETYRDGTLTNSWKYPFVSKRADLSSHYYLRWDDQDSDGAYDFGECGFSVAYRDDGEKTFKLEPAHIVKVADRPVEEQDNYANWFAYYRDRKSAAQAAVGYIVSNSRERIGLQYLNDSDQFAVKDATDISHRDAILRSVFGIKGSGDTPLRASLQRAGDYFMGSNSPILSESEGGMCQQNYAVLIGDGQYDPDEDDMILGSLKTLDANAAGRDFVRPSDRDAPGREQANTLTDVAMYYYQTDLRPDLQDEVPPIPGVDENNRQHLVTYTVAFGVTGTLDAGPTEPDAAFDWPEVLPQTATTIDDMRHAAWSSRGEFFNAEDPKALLDALGSIAESISVRADSTGSLEVGGSNFDDQGRLIQTIYQPDGWSGDIRARGFTQDGEAGEDLWSRTFGEGLAALENRHLQRRVLTFNPNAGQALLFTPDNISALSDTQRADLAGLEGGAADRADLIAYLKGDSRWDGGKYRDRQGHYLGDIIDSYPVIVAKPRDSYPDGIAAKSYATFRQDNLNRAGMVYVGANDGMLHAIDLENGAEKFAFMPHGVFSATPGEGVRQLARKNYVHRFYVNATPVARDAFVQFSGEEGKSWHTLLTGGLGAGGKSVYLLDITDPAGFATAAPGDIVKWEFAHPDLGYSFSEVQVAKLADDGWYAIFGNGYNAGGDGKAKLFIVNLENPGDSIPLDTTVGSIVDGDCQNAGSDCNGLSSPEIADLDGDGVVDWVYAGDLHGNLWTFDLTGFDGLASSVAPKRLLQSCAGELVSGECPAAYRQPITTRPALARNPRFSASKDHPNVNVFWGTGQLLSVDDKQDTTQQAFYSVLHKGDGLRRYRSDLVGHIFTDIGDEGDARTVNGQRVNYTDTGSEGGVKFGWYLPLADSGERLVNIPSIRGDLVTFNTTVPPAAICDVGADGWINAVNLLDGLTPQRVGGNNHVFDYDGDGVVDSDDSIGDSTVLAVKVGGAPTAPKFQGDTQQVGTGATESGSGGVQSFLMNFGGGERAGRSAWFQLR